MQQRQPRLGEIVDDYCPRERRITNHAVVAMVGDAVKQTRCTTCDADHEYKHAKVPPQRRKKEEGGVLYQQVLAGMPRKAPGIPVGAESDDASDLPVEPPISQESEAEPDAEPVEAVEASAGIPDESVHRPLIRATLPRLTDEPPQRREPEFTMRAPQHTRPGKFGRGGFRGGRPGAAAAATALAAMAAPTGPGATVRSVTARDPASGQEIFRAADVPGSPRATATAGPAAALDRATDTGMAPAGAARNPRVSPSARPTLSDRMTS